MIAVPLSLLLNRLGAISAYSALLVLLVFVLGSAWLCRAGERIFREKDSQKIVVDEIAGFLLANFCLPLRMEIIALAFLLFRFFDIMKVFPAAALERRKNGVLLDDLVAGFYTFLILRLMLYWEIL